MRIKIFLPLVALVAGMPMLAAVDWTVDDVLMQERAAEVEISRDASKIVWVKSKMNEKKGASVSQLVLRYLADGHEVQLTTGEDSAHSPKFSPDGTRIAFLTARGAPGGGEEGPGGPSPTSQTPLNSQIWIFDIRGGEPTQITRMEQGIEGFEWQNNETILFYSKENPTLYAQERKKNKDTSDVVYDEEHEPPSRLFSLTVKGGRVKRLTTNDDRINKLVVSPDGRWAVTTHNRSLRVVFDGQVKDICFLHHLESGTVARLFPDGRLYPRTVAFTPDSSGFYFSAPYSHDPMYFWAAIDLLYYYDLAAMKETKVDLDWDRALDDAGVRTTPDGFVAILADGARPRPARYTRNGAGYIRQWIEGERAANIQGFELSLDGKTIVYDYSTAGDPGAWYRATLTGNRLDNPGMVIKINSEWEKKSLAKSEIVTWKGAKDEEVEGILYYPHNYQSGKKYPLVAMIHGGPYGVDTDSFRLSMTLPIQLMAERGAFVFRPNYHGSAGYGLEWGESICCGNYGELEWQDVNKGVDSLIEKGLVDPDKLGVMGWSNGSIITIELTTRTTRFKAASAGAGDVNWTSDWGNAVFGDSFDNYYLGSRPMDAPELYIEKSPLFRMEKVRTPTIIFFGTIDRQVPTEQGWQHYQALKHYGNTDVKMVLFPGEAHGPRKLAHQRRKMVEELAWFDRYLFETAKEENAALQKNSPLAAAVRMIGTDKVPETVRHGNLMLGRFEVTRAQYGAFDAGYKYPAGTGRYPANGVSFDKAKAYCDWLSKESGARYRLGTEKEMSEYLKGGQNENTLDAWAGYQVNIDDAKRLESLIESLGEGALLKPVGSYPGSGNDPVYDLGGNVAEWVVSDDGKGKAMGGSADRPLDSTNESLPKADYIGFRVVKE